MGNRRLVLPTAVAAIVLGTAASAQAATITVNTKSDTYGHSHCSLRDAVQAVDTKAAFGTCPAGTGGDTIVIPAGLYKLTITPTGPDGNSTGDLNLTTGVTIEGTGATIDAGKIDRIFDISTSDSVTISGLTLTGGQALMGATGDSTPSPGSPGQNGGAILNAGDLTLTSVTIKSSTAGTGGTGGTTGGGTGAAGGDGGSGGGVYSTGRLTLEQVTMTDDKGGAGGTGGAAFPFAAPGGPGGAGGAIATSGSLAITGGTFSHDAGGSGTGGGSGGAGGAIDATATLSVSRAHFSADDGGAGAAAVTALGSGGGGGAVDAAGTTTVLGSTFSANQSGVGSPAIMGAGAPSGDGGALLAGGKLTLRNDTFSNNVTHAGVSGSGSGGSGSGGAVSSASPTKALTISGSTFKANATGGGGSGGSGPGPASGSGGAISAAGPLTISSSTFTGNQTGAGGSTSGTTGGSSGNGGAIWSGGALTLTGSTLSVSIVGAPGSGGSSSGTPGSGEALYVAGGKDSLLNDTLTGNRASGLTGAAYFTGSSSATLTAVTDAVNQGFGVVQQGTATVALADTLLSSNKPSNCNGTIADQGHNLSFGASDTSCPSTFSQGDPNLALGLAGNGGTTQTLALRPRSAAIDAGPAAGGAGCPASDQRGMPRPQGSACDIGAFEFAVPSVTILTPGASANYRNGQVVRARYRCTEGGKRRFVVMCTGPVASGQRVSTSTAGRQTFTVTATDAAGQTKGKTVRYRVSKPRHRHHR